MSILKQGLNVSALLKVSTILIWLIASGLILYSLLANYRAAQRMTLEGHVITAGGDPADEAVVNISLKGQEITTTTSKGKFSVEIDLTGTDRRAVPLVARWHGLEASAVIDLSTNPPKGLVLTLPAGPMPLRISYFLIGGFTIDFLIKGQINKEWEEKLSGQPFIIPNSVFNALSELVRSFSGQFDHDMFLLDTKTKTDANVGDIGLNSSFFVGTWRPKYFDRPVSTSDLRLVFSQSRGWNVEASSDVESAALSTLFFWKFADKTDLASFSDLPKGYNRNEWIRFYSHISSDYLPPDFSFARISLNYCGDVLTEALYSRVLQLRVALIENNSSHPVRIGRFQQKENPTTRLRSREVDQATLTAKDSTEQELFPSGILNPGEKILIPTEISFVFEKELLRNLQEQLKKSSDTTLHAELVHHFSKPEVLRVPTADGNFEMTNTDALNSLNTPVSQVRLEKEYIYNHSLMLQSVEVDKVKYEIRKFDPEKLVLHAGDESGSCPYVFTRANANNPWRNEGEILLGRRGKNKESVDQKELSAFDGTVLLKENDAEESFIDYMYVRSVDNAGNERRLYPKNALLRDEDANYARLKQGQQLKIEFDLPVDLVQSRWSLVVKGYYEPLLNR